MRLIDADELVDRLNELGIAYRADINKVIADAQTIDIVTCKECIHWDDSYYGYCRLLDRERSFDGYCSDGERKE